MTRKSKYALMAILTLGLAIGAFLLWREYKLEKTLARLQSALNRRGMQMEYEDVHWLGLTGLEFGRLSIGHGQNPSITMRDVQLEVNPWGDSPWQKIRAVHWGKMEAQYKDMAFEVQGAVFPSQNRLAIHLHQSTDGKLLSQLDLHLLVSPTQQGLGFAFQSGTFVARHEKLSAQSVAFPALMAQGHCGFRGPNIYLQTTQARSGQLPCQAAITYDFLQALGTISLQTPMAPFKDFHNAFPANMAACSPTRHVLNQVEGHIAAELGMSIPFRHPEKLQLRAALRDSNLDGRILAAMLAQPGHGHAQFDVRQLSPPILRAILLSEDANFYAHQGFDIEILQAAMAENLQTGRFVRGGGTISMQYVRNAFLNQQKTLLRKLDEMLFTVALERGKAFSKDEILGRYLGQIEWGPNVHGIEDASQFYFHKTPQRLTLDEGLFLAAIIPNPRQYQHLLLEDGHLNAFGEEYFSTMKWMLFEEEWIGEEELDKPVMAFHVPKPSSTGI
jgi:hypothetical protein